MIMLLLDASSSSPRGRKKERERERGTSCFLGLAKARKPRRGEAALYSPQMRTCVRRSLAGSLSTYVQCSQPFLVERASERGCHDGGCSDSRPARANTLRLSHESSRVRTAMLFNIEREKNPPLTRTRRARERSSKRRMRETEGRTDGRRPT